MLSPDLTYCNLPWRSGGRSRSGLDCAGLALLWLNENVGPQFSLAPGSAARAASGDSLESLPFKTWGYNRGDIVFFRFIPTGKIQHVAICLGRGLPDGEKRYLHILQGCQSRIDTGLTLLKRLKMEPVGSLPAAKVQTLCAALANPDLGYTVVVGLIISAILYAISYALTPKLSAHQPRHGQYSQNALITQKNPEIPLPDILGTVVVAGNSIFEELPDRGSTATPSAQKWDSIIVLCSGPVNLIDYQTGLQIKGTSWQDKSWYNGTNNDGIAINPDQLEIEAVTGTIAGDSNVPSITLYDGAYDITVPVDVRAQYDRDFPIYGLSGCAYLVLRAMDATKFSSLNFTTRIQGRLCRVFSSSGFAVSTALNESLAGADGTKVRFKLAQFDIKDITSITVNGTSYTEISPSNQAGNIYQLNRTKGFLEFLTAPANAATITITYDFYQRAFSVNPASHVIYLLTEPIRGKGLPEDRIDWTSADAFQTYCATSLTYVGPNGSVTQDRWDTNYAVDDRKPIQDHIQAILDASNGQLILSNGKFVLMPRSGTSSVFDFDTSSILTDNKGNTTFHATLVDRSGKSNRVHILFHDEPSLNAENEAVADDVNNQDSRASRVGNNGVVDDNLKFPAVTDANQAQRLAELILAESVNSNWIYEWKTNIQGLALQPGDLVTVTHPALPGITKTLRLEALEYDQDDLLKLTASEYVPQAYL